jgi:transcriptional regulator with XRE-family HTH domain
MSPIVDYEKWRVQQMLDPEFMAEIDKLEPGYQVARLRVKLGLTQAQLAEMVGTRQPSIARLENGEGSPSLSFLEKVAKALGADVKVQFVPRKPTHEFHDSTGADQYEA